MFNGKTRTQNEEIVSRLKKEFQEFMDSGRERIVLSINELSPEDVSFYKEHIKQGWRTFQEGHRPYYDFELLEQREQRFVLNEKNYQVIAFARPNALHQANYVQPVIEITSRVIANNTFLVDVEIESNLKYHSIKNLCSLGSLEELAKKIHANKATESFFEGIDYAKESYDAHTTKLMLDTQREREASLIGLSLRNEPADEYLFKDIRNKIIYGDKK